MPWVVIGIAVAAAILLKSDSPTPHEQPPAPATPDGGAPDGGHG